MPHDRKPLPPAPSVGTREIQYAYSRGFVAILQEIQSSLLVSTYQASKLAVLGVDHGQIAFSFHNFPRAMGVAVSNGRIAVATEEQVWILRSAHGLAPDLRPSGRYDSCFLARTAHYTGEIHGHEICWCGKRLWVCNTLFSCLAELDDWHSFVPRWRPGFISELAAEDRCHLNGVAVQEGRAKYVTVLGESDSSGGWREKKASGGCLIDVPTGKTIARGFAMPHSPRIYRGRVWLLDSGTGRLVTVEPSSGNTQSVTALPGYTRGLAILGQYAFVGLSKIRETSTFGGIPVAERRDELRCGVAVVDLRSGASVALLEFKTGVDEIFDVQVLPGIRCPMISGPYARIDGLMPIWVVPESVR